MTLAEASALYGLVRTAWGILYALLGSTQVSANGAPSERWASTVARLIAPEVVFSLSLLAQQHKVQS